MPHSYLMQHYDWHKHLLFSQIYFLTDNTRPWYETKLILASYFCLNSANICFVMTHFFTTKLLSQHAYFCHNKRHVLSQQTLFVKTKLLLWQKLYLRQLSPMIDLWAPPGELCAPSQLKPSELCAPSQLKPGELCAPCQLKPGEL